MSTKYRLTLLFTFLLLVISQFAFVSAAAQGNESQPNAYELAFQEAVSGRTGFRIFVPEIIDLTRIETLLAKDIRPQIRADALARAAAEGDQELLQLLIRTGADTNYADGQGQTTLMLAAAGGHYSQCGNDPLIYSYRGHAAAVKSLLAAGAQVNAADQDGNTGLMLATKNGRADSVRLLLDSGSDVHLTNKYGWTALIYAASASGTIDETNLIEIVAALIAAGSNLNVRDAQGKTALAYAAHPAVRELLIRAGAIE